MIYPETRFDVPVDKSPVAYLDSNVSVTSTTTSTTTPTTYKQRRRLTSKRRRQLKQQEYPIKYINIINKLSLLFKNVNIHMGNDLPIKVTGKINDESWIRMILAPKITD